MTVNDTLLEKASAYVSEHFEKCDTKDAFLYHDLTHTKETVTAAKAIAEGMKLPDKSVALVMLACWFHDVGCVESIAEHEAKSIEIAEAFFNEQNTDAKTRDIVKGCILATKIPQSPRTLLQQIVCDADMSHLGSTAYAEKSELLRKELEKRLGKSFSEVEWLERNIGFFIGHSFFTTYAQQLYNEKKNENLVLLQDKLKKEKRRTKKKQKQEEQKKKPAAERGVERNMEVYYRTASRNHVSFSSIVDQKANIMIQTNSLIFSIIISLLVRKLDQLPDLIIPTFLMLFTCVATIITSVLATRPKVTRNETTIEKIKERKANLLYFGSFVNLDLDQYVWGVKEMLRDKPYYIENMIRDTYYLGKVLDKKYKYLRLSYDIFMVGLVLSISLYAHAFVK